MLSKLILHTDSHEIKLIAENFRSNSYIKQLYDYGVQPSGLYSFNGDYLRTQVQQKTRYALEDRWFSPIAFVDHAKTMFSYSPQRRYLKSSRAQMDKRDRNIYTYSTNDYKEKFWQADVQFMSSLNVLNTEYEFIYGFQGDATITDYQNTNIKNSNVTYGGGVNFANANTLRTDTFLQDEVKLLAGRLKITPGISYATYRIKPNIDHNYVIIPGKEPQKIESKRFIPQLGAIFNLTDQYALYGRYSEGFKMPTAQQLYTSLVMSPTTHLILNPYLKAEKVKSYEAGIRGEFTDVWISFGGFKADYKDYIQNLV